MDAKMKITYKHYISLGYFCGVAQDLEKLGLRNQSSPFDWGISYFENVIDAIENSFDGFMDYENLSQSVNYRNHYHEDRYHFYFFHDFSQYKNLDDQYEAVLDKYKRRIDRFLQSIQEPTLFVKYISTEELDENGRSVELNWIEKNYDRILSVLRKKNSKNDILFIGDETVYSDLIKVYKVKKDEGDQVSRHPIFNNEELYSFFSEVEFPGKEENKARYEKKERKKKTLGFRMRKKIATFFSRLFLTEYKYTKTYDIPNM